MKNWNQKIIEAARRYEGLKEWPGAKSNPDVESLFADAGFPGLTDDVPWCAGFIGAVLAEVGLIPSGSLMARSYLTWGMDVPLQEARPGDVVIFPRGAPPAGHVAFFVGFRGERVIVLGGNQDDMVKESSYATSSILKVRRADPSVPQDETTVRFGSQNASVVNLQTRLHQLNYFTYRIDGIFGKWTDGAVRAFQADHDLEADGVVGNRTWKALKEAQPRLRDNPPDAKTLKKRGSTTIASSDKAKIGVGGLATVAVSDAAMDAVQKADGMVPILSRLVTEHWPVLLLIAGAAFVWIMLQRIDAARVKAAATGANLTK